MQLLDCAVKSSQQWSGQVHGLLWVWFLASVRRLRAAGTAIKEEPKWRIDIHTVDPWGVTDLPGLRSPTVRGKLEANRLEKDVVDVPRLVGGEALSKLAMLNITVNGAGATVGCLLCST